MFLEFILEFGQEVFFAYAAGARIGDERNFHFYFICRAGLITP
jgi:hypothetical protein